MHTIALTQTDFLNLLYLLAAVLFIYGLKMLSKVNTAARGNLISALGMFMACAVTFVYLSGDALVSLVWIVIAVLIGSVIGVVLALKVPMTGMPQMVALFNGFGGI
ncbi:MAG: NAD(P)(+) transhydrogenase (Re/Si-specific) subunit beta, partial [Pirellulaceae bacterium]|nr:NAD(P)(+) transhydrogenase (Re/Si-specific) subunit beta [Pirellulaceae bacterium]